MHNDFSSPVPQANGIDGIKITNAVYKVLDFFPDSDPLKNKAKEKALAILDGLTAVFESAGWVSLKSYLSPQREQALLQLSDDIEMLENYLKIAKHQGWIENVNLLILLAEYDKIKSHIHAHSMSPKVTELSLKDHVSENVVQPVPHVVQNTTLNNLPAEKLSARQEKIIKIVSEKGKAQVADIIKRLPNITKRTIRRDLDDLLKKGEVLRVGAFNQVSYQIK